MVNQSKKEVIMEQDIFEKKEEITDANFEVKEQDNIPKEEINNDTSNEKEEENFSISDEEEINDDTSDEKEEITDITTSEETTENIFDEKKQMAHVVKSFKDLFRFTNPFKDIRADKTDALEKLEKAIKGINPSNTLVSSIEENLITAKKFIEKAKNIRSESFKRHEAEYIKSLHSENKPVREYSSAWRMGNLMIKVRPGLSKIKILYNDQTLINWTSVNSKEDFIDLENRANAMLKDYILPENELIDVFYDAFKEAKNHLSVKANASLVPILDFYKEFRISLIRKLLESKGSAAKIDKYQRFPLWAFLYNLDIYRSLGSKVPDNKRLGFQTGSMQETSQNKGLVVNGLNPNDDYKVMCYVIPILRGSVR
jgi:hypothetical protein